MSTSSHGYHHGDLRAALLDSAEQLLDAGGDGAVSLRAAARMAGVSPAAGYRHFDSKEALLSALAARQFAALGEAMAAAGGTRAGLGRAYVRFALRQPGRFRLMFGPLLSRAKTGSPLQRASEAAFAAIAAASPSRDDALRAWSLVHGLAHLLLDGAIPRDDGERVVERLIV